MSGSVAHPFPPVYDGRSRILILGSFPSVRSRAEGFFYGHPQNRFWRVLARVLGEPVPRDVPEKRAMLLANRIALWDVIRTCEIEGSHDDRISRAEPNDLSGILSGADIRRIFANGRTAERLYRQHLEGPLGRPCVYLPSTSPANAAWSPERLAEAWSVIRAERDAGL